jgi:hypothetical protein
MSEAGNPYLVAEARFIDNPRMVVIQLVERVWIAAFG